MYKPLIVHAVIHSYSLVIDGNAYNVLVAQFPLFGLSTDTTLPHAPIYCIVKYIYFRKKLC